MAIQDESPAPLQRREHSEDASAKRVVIRALEPDSGAFVNVGAYDNGDGTFSLKTTGAGGGGGDASAANQVNGNQKTRIVDADGDEADVVESTDTPGVNGLVIVNPDGSTISGGSGGGTAAYSDSGGVDKKGLVDSDRHVQTDVLSSALPSGAATSAKQDTGNASLSSIDGKVVVADTDNVTIVDMPPVTVDTTGLATEEKQDDEISLLTDIEANTDGIEGLLTTIDGDTGSIATSASSIDTKLSTSNTNTGNTATNTTDIPNVIGTDGATGPSKAVSVAGTDGSGNLQEISTNTSGHVNIADGGNSITIDGTVGVSGTVTVDASGSTVPVSNGGLTELAAAINSNKVDVNIVSSDVATGGTSAADDADFTAGTTPGTPAMGVFESSPTNVTDGDMGIVGITTGRRLKTSSTIDAALPAGTNAIGKLSANDGVDIGDVTVNNASGGSAVNIQDGGNSITVDQGTATNLKTQAENYQGGSAVGSGNPLQVTLANTGANSTAVKVDGSTVTQPVSDGGSSLTVDANNLDIRDIDAASDDITIHGDVGVVDQFDLTNSNPIAVAMVDSSGDQVSSFGGGTQYTEGDTDATPTGTAMLWRDSANSDTLRTASFDNPMPVRDDTVANNTNGIGTALSDLTQALAAEDNPVSSGQYTFMAGVTRRDTPGNTSDTDGDTETLQVAGGRLWVDASGKSLTVAQGTAANLNMTEASAAAIKTAVEIMDDWDESDRAKVNLISGQAGVDGNSGNKSAATQRVVIATDQPQLTNAFKVDGTGGSFPVTDSGGSLTVDNNGTFAVQVDGSALTSLQLIDDIVYTDDTSTHSTGSSKGALMMAAATPTDTAVNANDIGAVGMTNNREMYVSLRDVSGQAAATGSGTATAALRVEIANNGTGTVGLNAGTNAIGKLAANSGVDIGDVDVTSTTFPTLSTASTYSPTRFANLGANATLNVKSSAGNVLSLYCNNENAADRFIQLHNTATTPSASDAPLYVFRVPAGGDVLVGTDFFTNAGVNFSTGIAFAFSTTKDTYTAGSAGDQSTIVMYK